MRTSEIVVPLDQGEMIVKPLFVSRMAEGSSTQVRGRVTDEEVEPLNERRVQSFRVFRLKESVLESPVSTDAFFPLDTDHSILPASLRCFPHLLLLTSAPGRRSAIPVAGRAE